MPKELEDLNTEQGDLDTSAALAEISTDLFGQGGESGNAGEGVDKAPVVPAVEPTPSPQPGTETKVEETPKPEETSTEVQSVGAPKTWSKEALQEWATLPPRAQQEILKREEDFLKGITMYKDKAEVGDRYDSVVAPFKTVLQAENIDPVQLFQSFASNHYLLSRGTEAQKLELAANMIQGYGIDFNKLIGFVGDRMIEPADPRVSALEQEIATLKQGQASRQQQEAAQVQQRLATEVDAFAADPAHPYFNELVDDIAQLFEKGQAENLQEAYDKAVYLNPTTRQKEIDRLTAERSTSVSPEEQARRDKIAKSTAADLSLDPKARNGTVPLGTIDDTLRETLARIEGRA